MTVNPNLHNVITVNLTDARQAAAKGDMKVANAHMSFLLGIYATLVTSYDDTAAAVNTVSELSEGMMPLAFVNLVSEVESRLFRALNAQAQQ